MPNITKTFVVSAVSALMLSACSTIDCPLNNRVYASFRLAGDMSELSDTLTVSTQRDAANPDEDTVLINRLTATDLSLIHI